jgi:transcriptional regulator with XRE-family HTH domain
MAGHKKTLGPTGARVARNVKRLRQARGLSYIGLSRRLKDLGHPILDTGLMRIEKGNDDGGRRVDVDDLITLALALDVTPNALLLPPRADDTETYMTPNAYAKAATTWRWATGDKSFPDIWGPEDIHLDLDREERFQQENRPHEHRPQFTFQDLLKHGEALQPLRDAVIAALDADIPLVEILGYVQVVETTRARVSQKDDHGQD